MKQGGIFTLGITHKSEISHEIETHQFEFEAVCLLTCCCKCLLVSLRHLSLWQQRCFCLSVVLLRWASWVSEAFGAATYIGSIAKS